MQSPRPRLSHEQWREHPRTKDVTSTIFVTARDVDPGGATEAAGREVLTGWEHALREFEHPSELTMVAVLLPWSA